MKQATMESLFEDARRFAARGEFREALRHDYIAVLYSLHSRNLITLRDFKTNGQLEREVKNNADELHADFKVLVNAFNYTWFGNKAIDAAIYNDSRETSQAIAKAGAFG
jgi:hypothetical protein